MEQSGSPISTECRLCLTPAEFFYKDGRTFFKCPECSLIFTNDLPEKSLEENHYRSQWEATDPDFWKKQTDGLLQYVQAYGTPGHILDFGAGSGEMTRELEGRGYRVTPLEPMKDGFLKDQSYGYSFDVVIGIEVIEHLADFWSELREIEKVLSENGIVLFSTLFTNAFIDSPQAPEAFAKWWYKDDPTHVSFFCNRSLAKMADLGGYDIDIIGQQVFVLRKASSSGTAKA